MMWEIIGMTIMTSGFDSLNPMAIGQQFVLQGLVKKPRDIWYFILATGVMNFLGGVVFYFSFATIFIQSWTKIIVWLHPYLSTLQIIGAILLFILMGVYLWKQRGPVETQKKITIKGNMTPTALVLLGLGATLSELATAFPYFAFIGWLMNQSFHSILVLCLMIVYNIIYMLPLMGLYAVYCFRREQFDWFYRWIQMQMVRWQRRLIPLILGGIGIYLLILGLF